MNSGVNACTHRYGHVINGYAAFGKQILDIAIGQAVAHQRTATAMTSRGNR